MLELIAVSLMVAVSFLFGQMNQAATIKSACLKDEVFVIDKVSFKCTLERSGSNLLLLANTSTTSQEK